MRFSFEVEFVPGKNLEIADALSRAPTREEKSTDVLSVEEVNAFVFGVLSELSESDQFQLVAEEHAKDETCRTLCRYLREGWPGSTSMSNVLRPYWQDRATLSVCRGVLMHGTRLVVPNSLQNRMLSLLHEGHQGIVRCRARARESVWWPGLSSQLATVVGDCRVYSQFRDQPSEPMIPTQTPNRPWQRVAADIFHLHGRNYLLLVDYPSRFPEICLLTSLTSTSVVSHIKEVFARQGIPEVLVTDNGPQFVSE